MDASEFERQLFVLDPSEPIDGQVDELLLQVDETQHESLLPGIFRFFELHASQYAGVPGTLVHFIESYWPRYESLLLESLQRIPSKSAVLMVNRVLNSELSTAQRSQYLNLLAEVSANENALPSVRDRANHFIEYQRSRAQQRHSS